MEPDQDDLVEAAIKRMTREGRSRLGGPPTRDQLVAYRRGELSPSERDRVEELLAHYPESVPELLSISDESDSGAESDDDLSEEELAREWEIFQARVGGRPSKTAPVRSTWRPWLLPLAASLFVGGILGLGVANLYRGETVTPRTGIKDLLLLPDDARKGPEDASAVLLDPAYEHFFLTLEPSQPTEHAGYRLEITAAGESQPRWSTEEIRRNPDGTFFLWLPRSYLAPGTYLLRLLGVDGASSTSLGAYAIRVP